MRKLLRYLIVVSVFISTAALADSPASSGLGQSWPNASDHSLSPRYHVFVFVKDGVRFIQVNDSVGQVRGAVATAGNQILVLPIGTGTQVVTPPAPAANAPAAAPAASTEPVYQDGQVTITAQPQSNGTLLLNAMSTCKDPIECNTKAASAPN
jgi:hypothetical protein